VYNPWSIVKYLDEKVLDPKVFPKPYWVNTSSNDIVHKLIDNAAGPQQDELENLMNGGTIDVIIHEDINYGDVDRQLAVSDKGRNEVWNFLFFTGYLKRSGEVYQQGIGVGAHLAIPNLEIKYVYQEKISAWVETNIITLKRDPFYKAIVDGDTAGMEQQINSTLRQCISYMDYNEYFYHGFMVGMLCNAEGFRTKSNRQAGSGRSDVFFYDVKSGSNFACVMEFKVAKNIKSLPDACDAALKQIEEKNYPAEMEDDGFFNISRFGIAFYKKNCMVKKA
jgi:hypothetical protein